MHRKSHPHLSVSVVGPISAFPYHVSWVSMNSVRSLSLSLNLNTSIRISLGQLGTYSHMLFHMVIHMRALHVATLRCYCTTSTRSIRLFYIS